MREHLVSMETLHRRRAISTLVALVVVITSETVGQAESGVRSMEGQQADAVILDNSLMGVNNGPSPYRADLFTNNKITGGTSPSFLSTLLNASEMSDVFKSMNVPSVRPNDLGGPFDLACMFPISSIDDIPDASSTFEDISSDPRWNWTGSDEVFGDILKGGFTPYLKLASREWVSGRLSGLSYVSNNSMPIYVINAETTGHFCDPWPYISPIMNSIGDKLILAIVERYNNESMWREQLLEGTGGISQGPPLEAKTWANFTDALVGVELQNEYNWLQCVQTGTGDTTSLEGWIENCGGEPYVWSGRYWDGTPAQAYESYVSQAKAIKSKFPAIKVGGPAIGTGGSFGIPTASKSGNATAADGIAYKWIADFLSAIQEATTSQNMPLLDWFSWHSYNTCLSPAGKVDCSTKNFNSNLAIATRLRKLLDENGFESTPMVVSEWNAAFSVNGGNTYPGTMGGAALMASNIAQFTLMRDSLKVEAAYTVNGNDGPFIPQNSFSFPVGCSPEFKIQPQPGDKPEGIDFTGNWVDNCTYGPAAQADINGVNGMGLVYQNGDKKPSAALFSDILSKFVGVPVYPIYKPVLPDSVVALKGASRLLLVNADPTGPSPALPSIQVILDDTSKNAGVTGVTFLYQHIRNASRVVLPNDISSFGLVQVMGATMKTSFNQTGIRLANDSIVLPPAGVYLFDIGNDETIEVESSRAIPRFSNLVIALSLLCALFVVL